MPVPDSENLGAQFLVRFEVNGTTRGDGSPEGRRAGHLPQPVRRQGQVANLPAAHPAFHQADIRSLRGVTGAIVATP